MASENCTPPANTTHAIITLVDEKKLDMMFLRAVEWVQHVCGRLCVEGVASQHQSPSPLSHAATALIAAATTIVTNITHTTNTTTPNSPRHRPASREHRFLAHLQDRSSQRGKMAGSRRALRPTFGYDERRLAEVTPTGWFDKVRNPHQPLKKSYVGAECWTLPDTFPVDSHRPPNRVR